MARRKQDPVLQKLRHLARSGRRREAVALLQETVQANPGHEKARDELARFLSGKPFSFEGSDYKALQDIISVFVTSPQRLGEMNRGSLKRLRHRSLYLENALAHMLSARDKKTLRQLRNAIVRELQRRRRPIGKAAIALAVSVVLLMGTGTAGLFLWKRAEEAANHMAEASKDFSYERCTRLLQMHDTGLNRTLNRRVGEQAARLRKILEVAESHAREIDTTLRAIERGEQTVVGQGVRRRARIERQLKELGSYAGDLPMRWASLCHKEQAALNQQRLSLVEELMAPLPVWQGMQGNPELDLALLTERIKVLQQRILIYEDAAGPLKLPESIIAAVRAELEIHQGVQAELKELQALLQMLPTAHDYQGYQRLLHSFNPRHYKPAIELMSIRDQIPTVSNVRGLMQEHGQDLPAGLLQAVRESMVGDAPSFSAALPATPDQLHLLNELLTNSALATRLYELTNTADNLQAYTEELPLLRYGRACFNRSSLDPERKVADNKYVEWQNPHSVVSRTLDPRPLYKELGLDNKAGFSSTVNLPGVITKLLRHQHPDVPPLAKAYILHYLLKVNNSGSHSLCSGLRYAPLMRNVVDSFEKLRQHCQVSLDGNCWLKRTPAHAEAERKYASWFRKHRKVDFAGELRNNLQAILNVSPQFCGYINEDGNPVLFEEVSEGQLIWYLSDSSMTVTVWGTPLQSPRPLSPVFLMERIL